MSPSPPPRRPPSSPPSRRRHPHRSSATSPPSSAGGATRSFAPDGHRDSTVGALSGLNEGGEIEDDGARLLVEAQANSQYFRGFLQDIDVLTKALSIVHFDPAETILQEGEPGTWVGLLLSGSLEVIVGGKCLRVMQPGDFVGEMILWFGGVRQGTVRGGAEGGVVGSVLVSELHELSQPPLPARADDALPPRRVGRGVDQISDGERAPLDAALEADVDRRACAELAGRRFHEKRAPRRASTLPRAANRRAGRRMADAR